ncbi:hypothetical protein K457DRAFT_24901 [Linnemannia elongata AG-77]|uniref:Transmembrane protein n=1 Tax=Linnemannia elongata AG-77 TaxID=1314771 RepID=A0A197JEL7_9FUNG|nr:hypothetical protein K457DRAFT_24901 [Linnemannia elongata AG-77]
MAFLLQSLSPSPILLLHFFDDLNQPPPTSGALTGQQKSCYCGLTWTAAEAEEELGSKDVSVLLLVIRRSLRWYSRLLRTSELLLVRAFLLLLLFPFLLQLLPPGENSTAATANGAAPVTPPVLSSTTFPMQQQSENAATSLTAVLGTIAAVFASLL